MIDCSDCDCDDIPMIPTVRECDVHEPRRPRRRRPLKGLNQNYNPRTRKRTRKRSSSSSHSDEKLNAIIEEVEETENSIQNHPAPQNVISLNAQSEIPDEQSTAADSLDSTFDINMAHVLESDVYRNLATGTYRIVQKIQNYGVVYKTKWFLFNQNEKIMDAKSNGKKATCIHMRRTSAASNFFDYELNTNELHNSFVLHANGEDIFSCAFGCIRDGISVPRFCDIKCENGILHFHAPILDQNTGHLMLDFLGLYVYPSIRNAVVINESMSRVMNIRVIDKDTIDVDCYIPTRFTTIFALGIASFLYDK